VLILLFHYYRTVVSGCGGSTKLVDGGFKWHADRTDFRDKKLWNRSQSYEIEVKYIPRVGKVVGNSLPKIDRRGFMKSTTAYVYDI